MSDEQLAINPDLIRKYAEGASEWGIDQLITLFDSQRKSMLRAEDLSRAYLKKLFEVQNENSSRNSTTDSLITSSTGSSRPGAVRSSTGRSSESSSPRRSDSPTKGEIVDLEIE